MKVPAKTSVTELQSEPEHARSKNTNGLHYWHRLFTLRSLNSRLSGPKSGPSNKINVLVVNETSHIMQLYKNTYLGNVQKIRSITSLEVKKVSALNSDE